MSNPWSKTNPFMSLWPSAAHRMTGSIRGQAPHNGRRTRAGRCTTCEVTT